MNKGFAIQAGITEQTLAWLGTFGEQPGGGVTRLLYSPSWLQAQQALAEKMNEWGLDAYFDGVGNLYGRLRGTSEEPGTILTGSHIDTVRNGGRYDGAYGVVAGMLALKELKEKCGPPRRTLEVVSLCEEEGSRFPLTFWGSGSITGVLTEQDAEGIEDPGGTLLLDAMRTAGFGRGSQPSAARRNIDAFIELHVEQGGVLEHADRSIGIVEQIVGQKRYLFEVAGEANHAGTTPMAMRKDALAGANRMIHQLFDAVRSAGPPLVATVGKIQLEPNIPNVIPGKAIFTVDMRHPRAERLDSFGEEINRSFRQIAEQEGLGLQARVWLEGPPVHMNEALADLSERICFEEGISCKRMSSGAGHDAQLFASFCPTALLFVPSAGGISHSPLEYTNSRFLEQGVEVLMKLLHKLAYER